MKLLVFVLAAATVASASSRTLFHHHAKTPPGQTNPGCTNPVTKVKITTTGEIIEGPACIDTTVNALRYNNIIRRSITETNGPDLFGSLSKPPAPIAVQDTAEQPRAAQNKLRATLLEPAHATAPKDQVQEKFNETLAAINSVDLLIAGDQKQIRESKTTADQEILALQTIVLSSDALLAGGAKNLITRAQADIARFPDSSNFNSSNSSNFKPIRWPDTEDTLGNVNQNIQQLNALQLMEGFAAWSADPNNVKAFDAAMQRATMQKTTTLGMGSDSSDYKTVSQQIAVIAQWTDFINGLQETMFETAEDVPCGALFNVTQNNTLQLAQTDRLPTLDLKDTTTATVDNWVIVRCSNPFSVSAGILFSFVADNEFGIVASKGPLDKDGNPTTVNKFQRTATSDVPKLPIVLAHVRLLETENKKLAFHGSFGVAAHSRSSSQGGSDPEYLFGGSISLLRTMFITGGPYWATRVNLGGGFSEGDTVPTGVTAPPLQKQGVKGWALAISFTKP